MKYYEGPGSDDVVRRYESADAAHIHRNLLRVFPRGARLLELGCGSGRDAAFLLAKGYDVVATDGSRTMLDQAVARHPELTSRMRHLPLPSPFPFEDGCFDGVYAVAVVMHLHSEAISAVTGEVARVLKAGGRYFVSVPERRDDVSPDSRDEFGRLFTKMSAAEWQRIHSENGLTMLESLMDQDAWGRHGITWRSFEFLK